MKNRVKVLFAVLFFGVFGCGIKGDPMPPAEQQTIQAGQDVAPAAADPEKAVLNKKTQKKNDN